MKKLAATKTWRFIPSRGTPKTRAIGTGSGSVGYGGAAAAGKVAAEPLRVGHLLGQRARHTPVGPLAGGDQGVAGGAELGFLDLVPILGGAKPPVEVCLMRCWPGSIW
jgi:hypothetical protein